MITLVHLKYPEQANPHRQNIGGVESDCQSSQNFFRSKKMPWHCDKFYEHTKNHSIHNETMQNEPCHPAESTRWLSWDLRPAVRTQWKIVVHCSGLRVNTPVLWHVLGTAAISIRVYALLRNRVVVKVTTNGQANLSSSFTKCRSPSALQATTFHYKDSDAHWCAIFVKHVFWKHRLSKRNKNLDQY